MQDVAVMLQSCKGCGANNEIVIGSESRCEYCGTLISVASKKGIANKSKTVIQASDGDVHFEFMSAVSSQNLNSAKQLLNSGADINAIDKFGETALMKAVLSRNEDVVMFLLDNGADTNIVNKTNRTALMLAINRNRTDMVKILRDYGVKK
jgi:ankyrin repeat protein